MIPEDFDTFDLTFMEQTEPIFGSAVGQGVLRTHPRSQCVQRDLPCCIHAPSNHHMNTWPMKWRADTSVMERTCPHGTGHPDPDHMAFVLSLTPEHVCPDEDLCGYPHLEWQGIHGCDGCC